MGLSLFATVPKGMESLLAGELRGLGAEAVEQVRYGVSFRGSLETAYRVCLWSRLASRVLLPLTIGRARDADDLYATVQDVRWDEHLGIEGTLSVDFTGRSDSIRDARFGALRVKDAIVDQFRARHGERRPSVNVRSPDLRVNAHLSRGRLTVSLDLSGESLHRRGYRMDRVQVEAPLKENLAAAVLLFAEWPREAAAGGSFLDPLCGSGTLPIEAAWMAADVAPGLLRAENGTGFGFQRWRKHDEATWRKLVDEASRRRIDGLRRLESAAASAAFRGSDRDTYAVRVALGCAERAGLGGVVTFEQEDLADLHTRGRHGLVAANAPHGRRLGQAGDAEAVYRLLGRRLRNAFGGWRAALLAGDRSQIEAVGLDVKRETTLYSGAYPCTLALCEIQGDGSPTAPRDARAAVRSSATRERSLGGGAEQFENRLRKNVRRLGRRLRREGVTCFRLYDADLPDYNVVIDVYDGWVHVQEYAAPAEIDPTKARRRLEEALAMIGTVLDVPTEHIVLKERRRQRGVVQYGRQATRGVFQRVVEDDIGYLVNLSDYLDTGLFLDQRLTRRMVRRLAGGRRFLNLFAYTGTMTVNALAGGSPSTTSIDLSSTYLEWALRNLEANGLAARLEDPGTDSADLQPVANRLTQEDCLRWLTDARERYDLIWLDPPTFSNSKRMGRTTFDVQRDHADLIRMTVRRVLSPGGILLFSSSRRGFRLHQHELPGLRVEDLSLATLPFDCERAENRHHVFQIERGS